MKRLLLPLLFVAISFGFSGCATPAQNFALAGVVATTAGSAIPSSQIEQTYYFGLLDPLQQIEPTLYRVRVRGQGSLISRMKFGSGWVPAKLIDPLGTDLSYGEASGPIKLEKTDLEKMESLKLGRRMIHFGPDGFREAPAESRLVIVMGASPETFFQQIDLALRAPAKAPGTPELNAAVAAALAEASAELVKLNSVAATASL